MSERFACPNQTLCMSHKLTRHHADLALSHRRKKHANSVCNMFYFFSSTDVFFHESVVLAWKAVYQISCFHLDMMVREQLGTSVQAWSLDCDGSGEYLANMRLF